MSSMLFLFLCLHFYTNFPLISYFQLTPVNVLTKSPVAPCYPTRNTNPKAFVLPWLVILTHKRLILKPVPMLKCLAVRKCPQIPVGHSPSVVPNSSAQISKLAKRSFSQCNETTIATTPTNHTTNQQQQHYPPQQQNVIYC